MLTMIVIFEVLVSQVSRLKFNNTDVLSLSTTRVWASKLFECVHYHHTQIFFFFFHPSTRYINIILISFSFMLILASIGIVSMEMLAFRVKQPG